MVQSNGYDIPIGNLTQATGRALAAARLVGQAAPDRTVAFHHEPGYWCLYGGVMAQGGNLGVEHTGLERGTHMCIACGDDNLNTIGLHVYRNNHNDELGDPQAAEAITLDGVQTNGDEDCTMQMEATRSDGKTLCMMMALDVR
jgi:hypothetical protein